MSSNDVSRQTATLCIPDESASDGGMCHHHGNSLCLRQVLSVVEMVEVMVPSVQSLLLCTYNIREHRKSCA